MPPIRLGIVGAGIFARDSHLPALQALGDTFEIVAISSRTPESAAQFNAKLSAPVDVYHDMADLLARDDIEAVDLALPITAMPAAIEAALAAGKHVISEKPAAPDVATGQRLLASYARYPDQVWMVAENYRYEAPFVKAREIVTSGTLGRPVLADWAIYVGMRPGNKFYHTAWRQDPAYMGGFVLDGGVHHVAGLRFVLGEVTGVSATAIQVQHDLPPVDTLSATLQFESGALVSYCVTYAAGAPWYGALHVVGERGALCMQRGGQVEVTVDGQTEVYEVTGFSGIEGEFAGFAAAIRRGEPHRNPPAEAVRDVAVVEAMLAAASSGQRVTPAHIRD
jgi:predicted dehydrogenase